MAEKTWHFEHSSYIHRALKPGTYITFQPDFIPYTSKTPNIETEVTIYCLIENSFLQDNETISIRGSLPNLGGWEHVGYPMAQHESNPNLWIAHINTPFAIMEYCQTGKRNDIII